MTWRRFTICRTTRASSSDLALQRPQLAASLRRQMLAALPAAQTRAAAGDIDAGVAGTLRALGYIE